MFSSSFWLGIFRFVVEVTPATSRSLAFSYLGWKHLPDFLLTDTALRYEIWLKFWREAEMKNLGNVCLTTIFLVGSVSCCVAEPLPTSFLGNWESFPPPNDNPDYLKLKCIEHEGVIINPKSITWNTEGGCRIDDAKRSQWGMNDDIAVSLTCYQEEGRQRPLKIKTIEIWSLLKINDSTIMSQVSTKDIRTTFFRKCE
jgi:hypothetical protein